MLFSEVETDGDYNSNLFASPEAVGDVALEVRPAARLVSELGHACARVARERRPELPRQVPLGGRPRLSGRGRSAASTSRAAPICRGWSRTRRRRRAARRSTPTPPARVPTSSSTAARGAFNHRFNRLSVQLRGAIIETSYGTTSSTGWCRATPTATTLLYEEAFRPKWEFTPTFYLFSDIAFNQRDYSIAAFTDGINPHVDGRALPRRRLVRQHRRRSCAAR